MKIILKYGLLAGVAIFIYILLELALGLHGKYLHIGQYTGYFRYLFLAAGIYAGINDLRHEPMGTVATYWSARIISPDKFIFKVHDLIIGEPNTRIVEVVYIRRK